MVEEASSSSWYIVGLGNPGKQYEMTRHNLGKMAVAALAARRGALFKRQPKHLLEVATSLHDESVCFYLLPTTYMNCSGQAVASFVRYKKVSLSRLLVLVDDVSLPFATLRLRERGSAGGHNGLRSLTDCLGSADYPRLRLGVGSPSAGVDLSDYVLGSFSNEESQQLPSFILKVHEAIEAVITEGMSGAMNKMN